MSDSYVIVEHYTNGGYSRIGSVIGPFNSLDVARSVQDGLMVQSSKEYTVVELTTTVNTTDLLESLVPAKKGEAKIGDRVTFRLGEGAHQHYYGSYSRVGVIREVLESGNFEIKEDEGPLWYVRKEWLR